MTVEQFMAQWPGATPDARFAAFLAWIDEAVAGIAEYLPAYTIMRDPAVANVSLMPGLDFRVAPGFFTQTESAFAVGAGDVIISALFQHANEEWYKQQKDIKEREKEYRKYLSKLWDKLLKDAKIKGDPGYAAWYYSYYLPKYYGDFGST